MTHKKTPVLAALFLMGIGLPACNPPLSPYVPPPSPTATPTPSVTPKVTFTPTPTGTVFCAPTTIAVSAGISPMTYGQSQFYDIQKQSDWDAYTGIAGSTPPVNLSTQRLFVENWGTESCSPGNGLVLECNIRSVCFFSDHIEVTVDHGSTCTCGGSCIYNMLPTQVSAAAIPASSLPVSVN